MELLWFGLVPAVAHPAALHHLGTTVRQSVSPSSELQRSQHPPAALFSGEPRWERESGSGVSSACSPPQPKPLSRCLVQNTVGLAKLPRLGRRPCLLTTRSLISTDDFLTGVGIISRGAASSVASLASQSQLVAGACSPHRRTNFGQGTGRAHSTGKRKVLGTPLGRCPRRQAFSTEIAADKL